MGDRANIVVQQEPGEPRIFLYTHWGGYGLPATLQNGLKAARGRWEDPAYATRIIAREMGMGADGETGFGIALQPCDNEYPYLVVDFTAKRVAVEATERGSWKKPLVCGRGSFSFAEYVELAEPKWEADT